MSPVFREPVLELVLKVDLECSRQKQRAMDGVGNEQRCYMDVESQQHLVRYEHHLARGEQDSDGGKGLVR